MVGCSVSNNQGWDEVWWGTSPWVAGMQRCITCYAIMWGPIRHYCRARARCGGGPGPGEQSDSAQPPLSAGPSRAWAGCSTVFLLG
eukprot:265434-Hanusia_phi.AAC.1